MQSRTHAPTSRWILAAALVASAAAAHAVGYAVNVDQEKQIKIGMSTDQVRDIVGHPASVAKYFNEPGPTWEYSVNGHFASDVTVFDVDFGADGKVLSVSERFVQTH